MLKFKTEHQNGKERQFKWLWTWHGFWCQMCLTDYFKNCWSTRIFLNNHLWGLQRMVWKKKISSDQQFSGWKCLADVRGRRSMARLLWAVWKAAGTHFLQTKYPEEHLWTHTISKQIGCSSRVFCWILISLSHRQKILKNSVIIKLFSS